MKTKNIQREIYVLKECTFFFAVKLIHKFPVRGLGMEAILMLMIFAIIPLYQSRSERKAFFPKGHVNKFSNLIGSSCGPDFPTSAHGHSNAYLSFCLFYMSFCRLSAKAFFKTAFIRQES